MPSDYYNDPPEEYEMPECCDQEMTFEENGDCLCKICGAIIKAQPDIEPVYLEPLPDNDCS